MAASITFLASFVYLLGFFVQSLITPPVAEDEDEHLLAKDDSRAKPCAQLELDDLKIKKMKIETDDLKIKTKIESIVEEADEEIVVEGKIPSYALESKLGDCRRAAAIRRKALQRTTEKSLEGLPLEGFDYESILGSVVRCRWATSRFRWASQGCCCSTGDTKNPLAVVDADYSYRVREQTIWLNDLT